MRPIPKYALAFTLSFCTLLIPYLYSKQHESRAAPAQFSHPLHPLNCVYEPAAFPIPKTGNVRNYSRAVIKPQFGSPADVDLAEFSGSFLESFDINHGKTIHQGADQYSVDTCSETKVFTINAVEDPPVEVTAPIIIGMSTRLERIQRFFPSLHSELEGTQASIVALVPPQANLAKYEKDFRKRGLDITLVSTQLDFTLSYFSLVKTFIAHIDKHRPNTKWVIWADDDTYIPSMRHLGQKLSTLDHTQDYMIGTLSEKTFHVKDFGAFPYGGAGMLISVSLVRKIYENYEYCMGPEVVPEDRRLFGGDKHVATCIKNIEPEVNMTHWPELRQFDLHDSPAGIYEDGRTLFSYHHWPLGSWCPAPVVDMALMKKVAGESAVRHRYVFNRWPGTGSQNETRDYFVLTTGYSIVHYHHAPGAPNINFDEREVTWREARNSKSLYDEKTTIQNFNASLAPMRLVEVAGIEKTRWLLTEAKMVGHNVHQLYKWTSADSPTTTPKTDNDKSYSTDIEDAIDESWIELIWLGS